MTFQPRRSRLRTWLSRGPGGVALFVVARAELAVLGGGVGQQDVGDDELGSHEAPWVFFFGMRGTAAVLRAQEGLGAAGAGSRLAQGAADIGIAAARPALSLPPAGIP